MIITSKINGPFFINLYFNSLNCEGSISNKIWDPSKGGKGIKLKIPKTILIVITENKNAIKRFPGPKAPVETTILKIIPKIITDIKLDKEYPKAPDDVNEFTLRDRTFMLAQLSIEYNPTPIFPENKDKTMHEWSFREVEFHLAYITCKTRIESVENRYQAHMQEKMYKENSGDS